MPFEMLYGYVPRFEEGLTSELTKSLSHPRKRTPEALQKIKKDQKLAKAQYDVSRFKNIKYCVGEIVYGNPNPVATPATLPSFKLALNVLLLSPKFCHLIHTEYKI